MEDQETMDNVTEAGPGMPGEGAPGSAAAEGGSPEAAPGGGAGGKPRKPKKLYPYPRIHNAILLCLLVLGIQVVLGGLVGFVLSAKLGADWAASHPEEAAAALTDPSAMDAMIADVTAETSRTTNLINLPIGALSFVVAAFVGYKRNRKRPDPLSFTRMFRVKPVAPRLWLATLVFFLGLTLVSWDLDNLVYFLIPAPPLWEALLGSLTGSGPVWFTLLFVAVTPGIFEEALCRGVFLSGFERNYSRLTAILVSALLFAILHLNPWQGVSAFVLGAAYAWICLRTGSLLPGAALHFCNNAFFILIEKIGDQPIAIPGLNAFLEDPDAAFLPWWLALAGAALTVLGVWLFWRWTGGRQGDSPAPGSGAEAAPAPVDKEAALG